MVHVLRGVHEALRPRGVLLDLHPLPLHPSVEVWRGGHRRPIGILDDSVGAELVRAARTRLRSVVREGLFRVEARRYFDMFIHFSSVDAWLERREEHGATSVIPPGLVSRARALMRTPGSELVVHGRIRATALRR